jgi:predicted HicB family RNase H-like nuclease
MAYSEAQKEASIKYAKSKLKRIPLDVQKEKYEQIKSAAESVGEKVNSYIKKAIDERMERDSDQTITELPQSNPVHDNP